MKDLLEQSNKRSRY